MEPMALGSTPSSPTTPPIASPNYLPSFLMGQNNQNTPLTPTHTPERFHHHSGYSTHGNQNLNSSTLPSESYFGTPTLNSTTPNLTLNKVTEVNIAKPGPPRQGLFDTFNASNTLTTSSMYNPAHEATSPSVPAPYANRSLQINESFNTTETTSDNANLWVTVFGFPSNAASLILGRFLGCGTIVDKRSPTQGNWIHLKFSTQQEAAKALALNGKLISNVIMVGVMRYNNNGLDNKENSCNASNFVSPLRARPLRPSFTSPSNNSSFMVNANTPQKSTGLVTKAMEYVFGW